MTTMPAALPQNMGRLRSTRRSPCWPSSSCSPLRDDARHWVEPPDDGRFDPLIAPASLEDFLVWRGMVEGELTEPGSSHGSYHARPMRSSTCRRAWTRSGDGGPRPRRLPRDGWYAVRQGAPQLGRCVVDAAAPVTVYGRRARADVDAVERHGAPGRRVLARAGLAGRLLARASLRGGEDGSAASFAHRRARPPHVVTASGTHHASTCSGPGGGDGADPDLTSRGAW